MSAPQNYSGETILDAPDQTKPILAVQGGGARPSNIESVTTDVRNRSEDKEVPGVKLVKLEKGFRVRVPDEVKQEIMDLDFIPEEERLFKDYLKFDKAFVKRYISRTQQSKEDFYDFWKLFVEKDGTDGYTLMTKSEGKKLQSYMENIVYAHRDYLIQSALRLLRKQDNPEHFEDVLNPEKEEGFIFAEVKPRVVPEAEAEAEEEEEEEDDDDDSEYEPDDEEEEVEDEEEEEEEEPAKKNVEFKELVKILNGREGAEKKLANVFEYLTVTFPKEKYLNFKLLMGIMRGSHFDISHGRIKVDSFFDLFREERDENKLSFGSLLNLLVRIDVNSIKDIDLKENFKEFFRTHIFNDPSGIKYKDRVIAYIEGKY